MENPYLDEALRRYPWVVYVEIQNRDLSLYGGTLITMKHVLTVASIFDGLSSESLHNQVKAVPEHNGEDLGTLLHEQHFWLRQQP